MSALVANSFEPLLNYTVICCFLKTIIIVFMLENKKGNEEYPDFRPIADCQALKIR